jgi:FkbM family methyltransferase
MCIKSGLILRLSSRSIIRLCAVARPCKNGKASEKQRIKNMFKPLFPDLAGFFEEERKIFLALRDAGLEAKNLFDVGSSTGGWSCMMSQVFAGAHFFLFDPLVGLKPNYSEGTTRTLEALSGSKFFKVALSDYNGSRSMFTDVHGFSSSLLPTTASGEFRDAVPITVRRLDDLLHEKGLPVPDILKLDVQGGEMMVLRGLGERLPEIKVIQAETWFTRGYGPETPLFHEVLQFLGSQGFVFLDIGGRFYTQAHELYTCDCFFVRRDVLESLKSLPVVPLA